MADPEANIPYFDIYDIPFMDDLPNPTLLDFSSHDSASLLPPSDHHRHHHDQYVTDQVRVSDPSNNNLLSDQNPDSWILNCEESTFYGGGSISDQAGPSGLAAGQEINNDQQFHQENVLELPALNNLTGSSLENTGQLPTWSVPPVPPVPFDCTNVCQVLREIVHVKEEHNNHLKLEIHGRLGLIYHAILERTNAYVNNNNNPLGDRQLETLDFCRKSCEEVKQFLTQYCLERKQEGYVMMMNDPLSIFYEALSIGLAWHDVLLNNNNNNNNNNINNNDHSVDQNPPASTINSENQVEQRPEIQRIQVEVQPQQQQEEEANRPADQNAENAVQRNRRRIPLSEQRKRTVEMTLMHLRGVLHLPLEEAALCMQVCETVIKKVCRKYHVLRWPYRKVKSIKGKIEKLSPRLNSGDEETRARAQAEIDRLRGEATVACGGISIL